ncbi:MAG: DUF362 domain-containing protein [Candidatus Helarchaeota archaeon]|nr:DUF362 domain-containing protein [Candidatus Helarchaeota archaeon]
MSDIYWVDARAEIPYPEVAKGKVSFFQPALSLVNKMEKLIQKSGILNIVEKDDHVAVKMHWGTESTTRTIRSIFIRKVVEMLNEKGAYVFITESAGLGMGKTRCYGIGRLQYAQIAGYTFETCLAPLIPADGLQGFDHIRVQVEGQQLKEVYIAKMIAEADKVLSLAHVKGHPRAGIGASIKNLGVGCAAKPSKFMIHFYDEYPRIDESKCNNCGKCRDICPAGAITDGYSILPEICEDFRCLGCYEVCREQRAIPLTWCNSKDTATRIVDAAKAVIDTVGKENFAFLNFILDVTPVCDCVPYSDTPVVPDLGILAGFDPLAIDKASLDMINQAPILPGSVLTEHVENKLAAIYAESFECNPSDLIAAAKKSQLGTIEYSPRKIEDL